MTNSEDISKPEQRAARLRTVEIHAEIIWRECKRRGWGVEHLVEKTGLSLDTFSRMPEDGPVTVLRSTADRIALAFEKNPPRPMLDELLTGGQT